MKEKDTEKKDMNRRDFLRNTAAASAFTIIPSHLLSGKNSTVPSEKINVAVIGVGDQGISDMKEVFKEETARVVAVCDVYDKCDYDGYGDGGFRGLQPARELVREKYGQACPGYKDYREMLEKEDIDAVLLATPDHSHAYIALDVIARKKHLYCEKPLCRTVYETRVVTEAARKAGVATQLGNFGHSQEGIRLTCEWIWDGAIGEVQEVHAWTGTGARRWTHFTDRPKETPPVPDGFDWKSWLDPVPFRPYHPQYAPLRWRAWWQFGSGNIGDFAVHHLDPAFWALKLDQCDSFTVEASSCGATEETCPAAALIYYHIPARAGMKPLRLTWYEGGLLPPRPAVLEAGRRLGRNGILYIGTKGAMLGGGWAQPPRIIPEAKMRAYKQPAKTLPRVKGHYQSWLDACRGIGQSSTHFDYSGPLTEFALMGNVAIRTPRTKLEFDWKNMKVTNNEDANQFIKPIYRDGMSI